MQLLQVIANDHALKISVTSIKFYTFFPTNDHALKISVTSIKFYTFFPKKLIKFYFLSSVVCNFLLICHYLVLKQLLQMTMP